MSITYRPGTLADTHATFQIFMQSILDLSQRQGVMAVTGGDDPAVLEELWERRRPLMEHLARTAAQFWVAEKDGRIIGYARSILRPAQAKFAKALQHVELTEFFILPGEQSNGIGGELIKLAFPAEKDNLHRTIIATTDSRALSLYLRAKVYPRFPVINFERSPQNVERATDLEFQLLAPGDNDLAALGAIDEAVLGYRRDEDHIWLLRDRQGYLYIRSGEPVGYGYVGYRNGPFALITPCDYPAVLAHAEAQTAQAGYSVFGVEVPMVNRHAVDYLLASGFRLSPFMALFLCDKPFGKFEKYLMTAPPFFL
jgi:GNAT superfamily N-acetyltransferase